MPKWLGLRLTSGSVLEVEDCNGIVVTIKPGRLKIIFLHQLGCCPEPYYVQYFLNVTRYGRKDIRDLMALGLTFQSLLVDFSLE